MERTEQIEKFFDEQFTAAREWYQYARLVEMHSRNVARAARTVAEQMVRNGVTTVEPELAYQAGLMHDIGKTIKGWNGLNHPIWGYNWLRERGYDDLARIAMTHTYYGFREVERNEFLAKMTPEDQEFTLKYMEKAGLYDLDRLIQLVDNMAYSYKIMTISDRFCDILVRHNIINASEHLRALYKLKIYFDEKCGMNIYELFREEIIETALEEPNERNLEKYLIDKVREER